MCETWINGVVIDVEIILFVELLFLRKPRMEMSFLVWKMISSCQLKRTQNNRKPRYITKISLDVALDIIETS